MAFPDDVALLQSSNAANVTNKTLANSISPGDVGGISDQICGLLIQLYGLIGAANNLQAVTALGNNTNEGIFVGTGLCAARLQV